MEGRGRERGGGRYAIPWRRGGSGVDGEVVRTRMRRGLKMGGGVEVDIAGDWRDSRDVCRTGRSGGRWNKVRIWSSASNAFGGYHHCGKLRGR